MDEKRSLGQVAYDALRDTAQWHHWVPWAETHEYQQGQYEVMAQAVKDAVLAQMTGVRTDDLTPQEQKTLIDAIANPVRHTLLETSDLPPGAVHGLTLAIQWGVIAGLQTWARLREG